ncbi:DUF4276 family protein [Tautonia sp. JC769]|uniref:DUF4276 family protein n=1 Tax=Tautonia sp. JC769 TaxID=3232135 RepID=UPI003458FD4F
MKVTIYVEGGGDHENLRTSCRKGFRLFLEKAGFRGKMPAIMACGSRHEALSKFSLALLSADSNQFPILLVDSEGPVRAEHRESPWDHLGAIVGPDRLARPDGALNDQAYLMVQCMESWFLADRDSLGEFFGRQQFRAESLPHGDDVEAIARQRVIDGLVHATRTCKKGKYDKGKHSFEILAGLRADRVEAASVQVKRLFDELRARLGLRTEGPNR